MIESLADLVSRKKVVLFAGAGLSVPLNLPDWSGLIVHMAGELGYDPDVLAPDGADYLQIAEFYKLERNSIGELRSWMDRSWYVPDDRLLKSRVHNQIVQLEFPLIYTTNYDRNIERIHELRGKRFTKIKSMVDIANAHPDATQIVKFHGDFDDDESLVVTESDYFERLQFEAPLDIKFRSDVLSRSILFIGYSLNDLNMRLLLYRLHKMWEKAGFAAQRPPCFIFLLRPDPVRERVLASRGIHPIVSSSPNPSTALEEMFDELLSCSKIA
ncbi:SIR2 family protein [Segnochrobactrum spirostomi]|uniref:Sir2 family NAD-dependent protein deacetylase n=1 Tax=Segnochrobactrum spirostomi TaxID=2608987 RepID=A0A6A7Y035_9HYPH|nr:SIR2 family protein [Segnochrobactrum spirostomi]MQT11182.1 Sir2 family NAD-dependent protein deacetylase [Segnochrobactrum spirostomi]